MVQSKKKQKKNADFAKVKLKVGKGKLAPSNATSIDIQSRTLIVPGQSLAATDKADALKTKRNLTLKELLAHLKHHNAHVRKDAVLGIQELVQAHPTVLLLHLGSIMQTLIQTMIDDDPHVRSTLLAAITQLAGLLDSHHAAPLTPTFVVYLSSAMNHINNDIRIDALQFMTPWLDRFPRLLCPHAAEILADFAGMLDAATLVSQGNAGTRLASPKVRSKVFYALAKYLHVLLEHRSSVAATSSSVVDAMHNTSSPMLQTIWAPATPLAPFPLFGAPASSSSSTSATPTKPDLSLHTNASVLAFLDAVSPSLLAFWMDAAGAAFGKPVIAASDALNLCSETVRVIAVILRFYRDERVPDTWARGFDRGIVRHLMQWFPFAVGKQVPDAAARVKVAVMNVHLAEIVARVGVEDLVSDEDDMDVDSGEEEEQTAASRAKAVVDAVAKVFAPPAKQIKAKDAAAGPGKTAAPASPLAMVTPEQFAADLVPSINVLLDVAPNSLAQAVLTWVQALPATHGTRMAATQYMCDKLLALSYTLDVSTTTRPFIMSLIRYVYELRTSALHTSLAIFQFLRASLASGMLASLGPQLTNGLGVYFYLPSKSPAAASGSFGPWVHGSPALQRLVLDTTYYLPGDEWGERLVGAITRSLCTPMLDKDVILHALDLLRLRTSPSTFMSAVFAVYIGMMPTDATSAGLLDVHTWHKAHTKAIGAGSKDRGGSKKRKSSGGDGNGEAEGMDEADPVRDMVVAQQALACAIDARFLMDQDPAVAFTEVSYVLRHAPIPTLVAVSTAQWILSKCALQPGAMEHVAKVAVDVERVMAASDAPNKHPLVGWVREIVKRARHVYDAEAWELAVVDARGV